MHGRRRPAEVAVDRWFAFSMVFSAVLSVCVPGVSCTYRGPKARWAGDAHASAAPRKFACLKCSSMYDPHCATVRALAAKTSCSMGNIVASTSNFRLTSRRIQAPGPRVIPLHRHRHLRRPFVAVNSS